MTLNFKLCLLFYLVVSCLLNWRACVVKILLFLVFLNKRLLVFWNLFQGFNKYSLLSFKNRCRYWLLKLNLWSYWNAYCYLVSDLVPVLKRVFEVHVFEKFPREILPWWYIKWGMVRIARLNIFLPIRYDNNFSKCVTLPSTVTLFSHMHTKEKSKKGIRNILDLFIHFPQMQSFCSFLKKSCNNGLASNKKGTLKLVYHSISLLF